MGAVDRIVPHAAESTDHARLISGFVRTGSSRGIAKPQCRSGPKTFMKSSNPSTNVAKLKVDMSFTTELWDRPRYLGLFMRGLRVWRHEIVVSQGEYC